MKIHITNCFKVKLCTKYKGLMGAIYKDAKIVKMRGRNNIIMVVGNQLQGAPIIINHNIKY